MTRPRISQLALACLMALQAAPVQAAGSVSCNVFTTALAFGQYVPSRSGASDFTATIEILCTAAGETPTPVEGSISLIGRGTNGRRELIDGANHLYYQLYLDPARTVPWGDGSGEGRTQSVTGTASGASPFRATVTVYGRVLARQSRTSVGRYSDQITAVLRY